MAPTAITPPPPSHVVDGTLPLPRILCLHGGGTNAKIFRAQCRTLRPQLSNHFRLVFADAPFLSGPGPDVESVFAEWGPFRSWARPAVRSTPGSWGLGSLDVGAVDRSLMAAMAADDAAGATGRWVGLLGFSQGAKTAGCLLLRQQLQNATTNSHFHDARNESALRAPGDPREVDFRFAVLMAGRGPLVLLEEGPETDQRLQLRLPTIHVHGTRDRDLAKHRELLHRDCEKGSTRLIEWDGAHQVPTKGKDVALVVAAILDVARETGAI
ncbi:serine hydrolase FSH [Aspergillus recurvatus]